MGALVVSFTLALMADTSSVTTFTLPEASYYFLRTDRTNVRSIALLQHTAYKRTSNANGQLKVKFSSYG